MRVLIHPDGSTSSRSPPINVGPCSDPPASEPFLHDSHPDAGHGIKITRHVVPAAHGYAFTVTKGTRFRIVDTHGEQVVDLMAWVHSASQTRIQGRTLTQSQSPSSSDSTPISLREKLSTAYTRYHLSGVQPAIGECLYTNADRPILCVTEDTVKVHDMTFMSCFPKLYKDKGLKNHRSCAQNIYEALQDLQKRSSGVDDRMRVEGLSLLDITGTDPFNCFQNTPNYSLKRLGSSRAGDYIEFEALEDSVVAVSSCPYDLDGFNGGIITDVEVVIVEKKSSIKHNVVEFDKIVL